MATSDETFADFARSVIEAVEESERAALDAVRRFVDSVDQALPGSSDADPNRRLELIEAALKMVERLLTLSNEAAGRLAETVQRAVPEDLLAAARQKIAEQVPALKGAASDAAATVAAAAAPVKKVVVRKAPAKKAAKKAPAKKAPAKKAPAKKAPAKKAPAKKAPAKKAPAKKAPAKKA